MARINQSITPADLASVAAMSRDYFSRVFKATYGVAPKSYIMQQRIRNAAQLLLESSLTVAELCAQIGEDDISKFCHQFRKVMGCTPTQYRRGCIPLSAESEDEPDDYLPQLSSHPGSCTRNPE